ncbi:hypothetical protein, partial [Streptomyces albidoflavus]
MEQEDARRLRPVRRADQPRSGGAHGGHFHSFDYGFAPRALAGIGLMDDRATGEDVHVLAEAGLSGYAAEHRLVATLARRVPAAADGPEAGLAGAGDRVPGGPGAGPVVPAAGPWALHGGSSISRTDLATLRRRVWHASPSAARPALS